MCYLVGKLGIPCACGICFHVVYLGMVALLSFFAVVQIEFTVPPLNTVVHSGCGNRNSGVGRV